MRLSGNKIQVEFTPLQVSGTLQLTGGSAVQFFDGVSYTPNREGVPASPVLLKHIVSVVNPDGEITIAPTTLFYENGELITASTSGYELIGTDAVKVTKNITSGTSVVVKAITKFVDPRNDKVYEREDSVTLRTLLKAEPQYILNLSQRGAVYFDAYRNPNTTTTVTATLKKGNTEVTDFTGIIFKWLNSAGLDAIENELYGDVVSADGRTLTVDKTYIDHEQIKCEAWKGEELIASDTVTFIRKFNSFRTEVRIPELPIMPGTTELNCSVIITDTLGNVDVDAAFLVNWIISENGVEREVATGASVKIPVSSIDLTAVDLQIYPDLKRREAFAAVTVDDAGEEALLTDDLDNVLTVETYGA
jgi:hypothetical protein